MRHLIKYSNSEISNRIADVDAEESRAIVAETSLQNNIDAEASVRVVGDESLEAAMGAADLSLDTKVSTETARAESAESSLEDRIDYIVSNVDPAALDSLTEIVGAFQSADGDLNGAISALGSSATVAVENEASIRLAADQSLAGDLSSEIADREAAVSLEEAARISGDASVNADLSAEVEAALIDAYPGLTNINRGSGCSSFGIMNVQQIQELYGLEQLDSFKHKVMFIKINKSFLDGGSIYDATRFAWKISLANATKVDYVLAVYRGVIKEVFKVDEWTTATRITFPEFNLEYVDRFGFVGYSAEKEIQDLYKNKRIPDGYQKKGSTNPIQYSK